VEVDWGGEEVREMDGVERMEEGGEEGSEREKKGRLIQERDRQALAWVGMNRVVREGSLAKLVFPGRDPATSGNRIWELARDLEPVGPYVTVRKRTLDDGGVERYLALTDVGYSQAESVLGRGWFQRKPTGHLKPSHIAHDLELADFGLSLMPKTAEPYQPRVRGRPSGSPVTVEVTRFPMHSRWRHWSVFRNLTVLAARKNREGRYAERPRVALAYEPDAILETSTFNYTRYFIEYDRGTEPIAGEKERRTILDKLRRIREYFLVPREPRLPGPHWSERWSYYLAAFPGAELRRPKVLFIATSSARAENIRHLASRFFSTDFDEGALSSFLEVRTVEEARSKLRKVIANAERSQPPTEVPWLHELRERDARKAAARVETERVAKERAAAKALADPLWVPYRVALHGEDRSGFVLSEHDARVLLDWTDQIRAHSKVPDYSIVDTSMFKLLDRVRATVSPPLIQRAGALVGLGPSASLDTLCLRRSEDYVIIWWVGEVLGWRSRYPVIVATDDAERAMAQLVTKVLFHCGADPQRFSSQVRWAKGLSGPDSPWSQRR
jgi:hypothetical protein